MLARGPVFDVHTHERARVRLHIKSYTCVHTYSLYKSEEFDSKLVAATRDDNDDDETVNIVLTLKRRVPDS